MLSYTPVTFFVPLPIPVEPLPTSEGLNCSLSVARIHLSKADMGRTDASELVPLIPLHVDGEEKALLCWDPAHPKVDKLCFGFAVILFSKGNLT